MTTVDKVLALIAFAVFLGFLAIIMWKVPRIDLGVIIAITLALVIYDGWSQLFRRSR